MNLVGNWRAGKIRKLASYIMLRIQEKILIHRAKRGDQGAFARLYNEYVQHIQRFVIFKISDKDKADELTNTIFVKTLNYLLKGQEIENFRAFLYQTARNLIIDFYRTRRATISLEEAEEISLSPNYHQDIDQKKEIEVVKKYLSSFQEDVQEIITLRFFEGLSFKEIAKITGQKESTARMIAHRGVKELKKKLAANN